MPGAGEVDTCSEDNLRVPSGVSYYASNRKMMMRLFPSSSRGVAPVAHYPDLLLDALGRAARSTRPVVVLTPGHLQQRLLRACLPPGAADGRRAGRGPDLFVKDDYVLMRTTRGPQRVDVIYRRLDDDFLDPLAFRPIRLGCPACSRLRARQQS